MVFSEAYYRMEKGDRIRRRAWRTGVYWEKSRTAVFTRCVIVTNCRMIQAGL